MNEVLLKVILYGSLALSFITLLTLFGFKFNRFKKRIEFNQEYKSKKTAKQLKNYAVFRKYDYYLTICFHFYKTEMLSTVVMIQGITYISLLITLIINDGVSILLAIFSTTILVVVVPIGTLYFRHLVLKSKTQNEMYKGMTILLAEYEKHDYDMLTAIKATGDHLNNDTGKLFSKLFIHLNGTRKEQDEGLWQFEQGAGEWGGNLSHIIKMAIQDQVNVIDSISNLQETIRQFDKKAEEKESENKDIAIMSFLTIPLTVGMTFAVAMFLPEDNILYKYILQSSLGIQTLILTVIVGLFNLAVGFIFINPKKGL